MAGDEGSAPVSGSPSAPRRPLHDMGILVTGGGSGIGLGISRRLLEEGAAVTIAGRSAQRLEEARQILIDAGADPALIRAHAADMSREDAGRQAVEAASDLRGLNVNEFLQDLQLFLRRVVAKQRKLRLDGVSFVLLLFIRNTGVDHAGAR